MSWHYLQGQEVASWEKLLGWRTVCAGVEYAAHAREAARAAARWTPAAVPYLGMMRTFDGSFLAGAVDVVSGGFPCTDISNSDTARARRANGADHGETWPASLAKFRPPLRSWKTSQRPLSEEWETFSATGLRSGLMHAGTCWELPTLGRSQESEWISQLSRHRTRSSSQEFACRAA